MLVTTNIIKFSRSMSSWLKPHGYDTGIKVYNCVAKNKVPLILKNKGILNWYTCGPTVYDDTHAGHIVCYLKIDIIQRIITNYFNIDVISAMNITDIDDKIIKKSKELKIATTVVSSIFEDKFWKDLAHFNIRKPSIVLRVSENIPLIQTYINKLIINGTAYETENGCVNFRFEKVPHYGKLIPMKSSTDDDSNDNMPKDCALWKASKSNEPFWDSPWGRGRPGWHVECSALASQIFGSSVDIHSGGMDLKFPHHENEEAHSCMYHNCPQWVNYWVHIGQLNVKPSEKMSKSLKNTISASSLLELTTPDEFRIACLMSHYRSRMEYSESLLKMAHKTLENFRNFVKNCDIYSNKAISQDNSNDEILISLLSVSKEKVHLALCDDFDTPEVISVLNGIIKKTNPLLASCSVSSVIVVALRNFFGGMLNLFNIKEIEEEKISTFSGSDIFVNILKDFRKRVRTMALQDNDKDLLKLCDEVRKDLKQRGIDVRDINIKQI